MKVDAAIRDASRIEKENAPTGGRMYFLIRSNVEHEGWTTDGVFAPKEAHRQISAMLGSAEIARSEGHFFVFKVFGLLEGAASPSALDARSEGGNYILSLPISGAEVLRVSEPLPLDY